MAFNLCPFIQGRPGMPGQQGPKGEPGKEGQQGQPGLDLPYSHFDMDADFPSAF
jgi:hypothetical protein